MWNGVRTFLIFIEYSFKFYVSLGIYLFTDLSGFLTLFNLTYTSWFQERVNKNFVCTFERKLKGQPVSPLLVCTRIFVLHVKSTLLQYN